MERFHRIIQKTDLADDEKWKFVNELIDEMPKAGSTMDVRSGNLAMGKYLGI